MKFDTSKGGLLTLFKPYQAALLEHIWELNNPSRVVITSGQAHQFLKSHTYIKSKASIIIFLNNMVKEGVLDYKARIPGGSHRVYHSKMNREQFAQHVVKTITKKLKEVFPSI